MKVIYKKSVIDKLVDEIRGADIAGREIEAIELDKEEFAEFGQWYSRYIFPSCPRIKDYKFIGIPIREAQ